MDVSKTSAIERVARVLAAQRSSINADGTLGSAGAVVDADWHAYRDDAIAILRTLREPDAAMARAGSPMIWEAMVLAALRNADQP